MKQRYGRAAALPGLAAQQRRPATNPTYDNRRSPLPGNTPGTPGALAVKNFPAFELIPVCVNTTQAPFMLSATPLLMRVEPHRQDPVPVVAQGEPDEREQVKVEPGDEYFLYERGRLILPGRFRLRDFVFFHNWHYYY